MKTIVTDLDGTLLNNVEISEYTIKILKEFQKENRLVLATGRNLASVEHIYKQLDMDKHKTGALILINGMSFYDFKDEEYISLDSFSSKESKLIILICHLLMFRVTVVGENDRVMLDSLYDRIYYIIRFIIKHKPMKSFKKNELPENIQKLEISGTIFTDFFFKILKIALKKYEIVKVNKYWIEILPKGINKVNMVKHIVSKYNINIDDLYIFGDGENDIEMLKYATHSYAPENAMECTKKVVNNICYSCQEDGVAQVIAQLLQKMQ